MLLKLSLNFVTLSIFVIIFSFILFEKTRKKAPYSNKFKRRIRYHYYYIPNSAKCARYGQISILILITFITAPQRKHK